jgi:hypothetical protein
MRIVILALFFFAGSTAFGQSGPVWLLNPNHSGSLPSPWSSRGRDFGKLPPGWPATLNTLNSTVIEPAPPAPHVFLGDAQIDRKMIVHPSQRNLGTQPPGTLVAQNLYPGLTFQPIGGPQCAPNAGSRSKTWPELKIERIPAVWPKFKLEPIGGNARQIVDSQRQ